MDTKKTIQKKKVKGKQEQKPRNKQEQIIKLKHINNYIK